MEGRWTFSDDEFVWENESFDTKEMAIAEARSEYGYLGSCFVGQIQLKEDGYRYCVAKQEKILF